MSHAISRATLSRSTNDNTAAPPTSAAVLDFICLFTHDLRRKQKRWQDGKLKFHTFNKRYMVYDDRGNFIGDGHWQAEEEEFEEGLELELDRGAAIVQVSECTGSREQDLTEILDKRAREVEKRRATAAARTPVPSARSARQDAGGAGAARLHFQQMHRPLSELMPNSGPIGRAAISDRSPFEARRAAEPGGAEYLVRAPPAKKRRVDISPPSKMGHAQSLFGTRLTLTAGSVPLPTFRSKAMRDYTNFQPESRVVRSQDDEEDESQDVVMVESSPPQPEESSKRIPPPLRPKPPLETSKRLKNDETAGKGNTKPLAPKASGKEKYMRPPDPESDDEDVVLVESTPPQSPPVKKPSKSSTSTTTTVADNKAPRLDKSKTLRKDALKETAMISNLDKEPSLKEKQGSWKITQESTTAGSESPDRTRDKEPSIEDQPTKAASRKKKDDTTTKSVDSKHERTSASSSKKDQQVETRKKETKEKAVIVPPKNPEPRTELRIKPRKRRGLLMLSEKNNVEQTAERSSEPPASNSHGDENDADRPTSPVSKGKTEANRPPEISREPSREPTPPPKAEVVVESNDESDVPVRNRTRRKQKEPDEPTKAEAQSSLPSRTRRTGSEQASVSNLSDDESDGSIKEVRKRSRRHLSKDITSDNESDQPRKESRRPKRRSANPFLSDEDSDVTSEDDSQSFTILSRANQSKKRKDAKGKQPAESAPRIAKMARKSVKCKEIFGFAIPDDNLVPAPLAAATGRIGVKPDSIAPNIVQKAPKEPVGDTRVLTTSALDHVEIKAVTSVSNIVTKSSSKTQEDTRATKTAVVGRVEIKADVPVPNTVANSSPGTEEDKAGTRAPKASAVSRDEAKPEICVVKSSLDSIESTGVTTADATVVRNDDAGGKSGSNNTKQEINPPPRPRIANPATRGKKAARKEHAAGQVPQCIVPFDPVVRPVARERPSNVTNSVTNVMSKPANGANRPGFSTANGGAWSKHAEDLLGMSRPAGRVAGR